MDLKTDKMIGEKRSGVGHLIFNNPEKRNKLILQLCKIIKEYIKDYI